MSYSKTTWANGDVITAAKLNNIEDGIAANDTAISGLTPYEATAAVVIGDSTATVTINKKAEEFYDAISCGKMVKFTITSFNGTSVTGVEFIAAVSGTKDAGDGTAKYSFAYVDGSGGIFYVEELAGTDDVVFTATIS